MLPCWGRGSILIQLLLPLSMPFPPALSLVCSEVFSARPPGVQHYQTRLQETIFRTSAPTEEGKDDSGRGSAQRRPRPPRRVSWLCPPEGPFLRGFLGAPGWGWSHTNRWNRESRCPPQDARAAPQGAAHTPCPGQKMLPQDHTAAREAAGAKWGQLGSMPLGSD